MKVLERFDCKCGRMGVEGSAWIEHYAIERLEDGHYALDWQVGWSCGSFMNGGVGDNPSIPEDCFGGSFEHFLDKYCEYFPAKKYGPGRDYLASLPGLRSFLGFPEDGESDQKKTTAL